MQEFEAKYRHARNPSATEHCAISCDIRHEYHHSISIDKQADWLRSGMSSLLRWAAEQMDQLRVDLIPELEGADAEDCRGRDITINNCKATLLNKADELEDK